MSRVDTVIMMVSLTYPFETSMASSILVTACMTRQPSRILRFINVDVLSHICQLIMAKRVQMRAEDLPVFNIDDHAVPTGRDNPSESLLGNLINQRLIDSCRRPRRVTSIGHQPD